MRQTYKLVNRYQYYQIQMNEKDFLHFGQIVYLECQQNYFMFSRSFIDNQIHLAHYKHVQCEFTFQQKNTQSKQTSPQSKKQPIIFGTQILIKHCYSNYYLSFINQAQGNQRVVLSEEINESCIFELVPQRTFEHKGDFVTINSSFAIRQTLIKSYIGSNILEMDPSKLKFSEDKLFQSFPINRLITARNESEDISRSYNMRLKIVQSKDAREEFQRVDPQEQLNQMNIGSVFADNQFQQDILKEQKVCTLPIAIGQGQRSSLLPCSIQRHSYTMWKAHRKQQNQPKYLKDNDYIYFVSSVKSKGTMTVNFAEEDRSICKIQFINKHNELEYECSAIFIVQIQAKRVDNLVSEQNIYLKHLLTGRYFPFNQQNVKKKLKLVPLLPLNNLQNKLPPFHIFFNGEYFPSEQKNYQATCGFWLNKVNKLQINEILSLQGMSHQKWIPYLTNYLDKERSKRQQLLRQFGLLKFMIYTATNQIKQLRAIYTLIFKMISQNKKVRRQMATYISQLLKKQTKEYIIDILSETLNNEDNFVEKYVQPEHLNHEITDFKIQQTYSITYLRIFRLFCGNYNEPCQRNQNALFELFFHEEESTINNLKYMTESYLNINRNKIAQKYKFKLNFKSKDQLQIQNCSQKYELKQLQQDKLLYLRQYLYLLGDCLKKNKPKLQQLKKFQAYKMSDLIDVLYIEGAGQLEGPILNLINTIYLEPQYKHKLYVYIKDYDQMCYQGSLVALQQNQDTKRLLSFINSRIDRLNSRLLKIQSLKKQFELFQKDNKLSQEINMILQSENKVLIEEYTSTKFKRFLIAIKYTIQNSYWNNINNLELIVDALYKLYTTRTKQEKLLRLKLQSDYSQVKQWRNYLDSTVIIIQIAILFLDIKINLCISNLVNVEEDKIQTQINSFIKDLESNSHFHRHFDYFQLCDAENQETMRKFLILSRRYYQIKSIIYAKYNEAIKQRSSKVSMKQKIHFIKQNLEQLKSCDQKSLRFCKEYIAMCCKDTKIQQISLQKQKNSIGFCPFLKNKKIASQYQILALKLGIIGTLRENIQRYINLRYKQKFTIQENIYWKLLLFYVLIKNNSVVKKQISEFRQNLIHIVNEENENSLIAIDILYEIYQDNRSLLVSDRQSIRSICIIFIQMLVKQLNPMYQFKAAQNKMKILNNIKINKLIYLILSFLTVNGKRIKNNYSLIAKELFDRQIIMVYICKFKNIQNRNSLKPINSNEMEQPSEVCENSLFQILLFILAETLEQKPQKLKFSLPKIDQINSLLLLLGKQNWKFTFSIFHLIYSHLIEINKHFVKIVRNTLNYICQIALEELKQKEECSLFQENEDLQLVLINFTVLIKIVMYIVSHYGFSKSGILQIYNPKNIEQISEQKLDLVQKLFLFRIYLPKNLSLKLSQLANMSELNLKEQQIVILQALRFKNLKADFFKMKKTNLIKLQDSQQGTDMSKSKLKKFMIKRESVGPMLGSENIIEWVQQITKLTKMKPNILKFQIKQAQQFIRSLILINKTDSNYLDLQLKEFFISFLINSFPYKPYDFEQNQESSYNQKLINYQNQLVEYSSADLVSILVQEKFKQNYGIFINIFQFGNKLLQGGNKKAQSSFYELFLKDHKNVIFENIFLIIQNSFIAIKFYFQSYSKSPNGNYIGNNDIAYNQIHDLQTLKERKNVCQILKKIFRFLQLLCQNDNQDLKKYVFRQINQNKVVKYLSINFLQIANNIFLQITKLIKQNLQNLEQQQKCNNQIREDMRNLIQILTFILDFLIQVCQYPAAQNQFFICQSNFFNCLRDINSLGLQYKNNFEQQTLVFKVKRKIVILIRGLLEQKNTQVIQSLTKKLQVEQLREFIYTSLAQSNITNSQQLLNKMAQNYSSLVEQIQNVVDILIICRILGIDIENGMSLEYCQIIYELKKQIREIQVCFKDKLTIIYFCYRPIFNYLSKETKDYFINRFSISESRTQKLKEFLNQRQIINQDIRFRMQRKVMSDTIIDGLFNFSISLCFILIALQLFFFSVTKAGIALDEIQYSIVKGLSYIQFMISVIYFIIWGHNLTSITKQKIKTKYPNLIKQKNNTISDEFLYSYLLLKQIYLGEGNSYHALILLFVSYFACFYELRIYAIFVLYIFARIQLLQSLLSAIRMTGGKLVLMCLLSLAFNFIFGVLSINNYIKVIYENQTIDIDIQHLSSHCTTLLTCIQSLFTQRIIGQTPSRQGDNSHYGRFFSDIVYWAFFDILIPNLIAAIIIDRFAQLRNLKQKIQNQEHNVCFICFANKTSFQRKNQDFDYHKQYTHNVWNYFYYLYYLEKLKSNTQYTGVQYWIIQQLKDQKIEWFPIDSSENDEDLSENKITRLLQALKERRKDKQSDNGQVQE